MPFYAMGYHLIGWVNPPQSRLRNLALIADFVVHAPSIVVVWELLWIAICMVWGRINQELNCG